MAEVDLVNRDPNSMNGHVQVIKNRQKFFNILFEKYNLITIGYVR